MKLQKLKYNSEGDFWSNKCTSGFKHIIKLYLPCHQDLHKCVYKANPEREKWKCIYRYN